MTKKLIIFALLIPFFIGAEDTYILNYDDVDIKKVTQDVASFSNKTLILDPKVKGKSFYLFRYYSYISTSLGGIFKNHSG